VKDLSKNIFNLKYSVYIVSRKISETTKDDNGEQNAIYPAYLKGSKKSHSGINPLN
jgi:hypothetical protein